MSTAGGKIPRAKPFVRLGRTIRKHRSGILAARRLKLSNARAEALTCGPITLTLPHEPAA